MSDKKHWLTRIVPVLAFTAGIIMSSVGGVMVLSSSVKLVLFEQGPHSYISKEQCRYDYVPIMPVDVVSLKGFEGTEALGEFGDQKVALSDEQIEECLSEKRAEEKSRFQGREKQDIVDGVSALIVGFLLILFFRKKK